MPHADTETPTPVRSRLHRWLWESEVPELSERWRFVATLYVVVYAIVFPIAFVATMQNGIFLGPGLGEPSTWPTLGELAARARSDGGFGLALAIFVPLGLGVIFRGVQIYRDYALFRDEHGAEFPKKELTTWSLVNAANIVGIVAMLAAVGVVLAVLGGDFGAGMQAIDRMSAWAHAQVMERVPTLVRLPSPVAFFTAYMCGGFVHYWLHRLGHTMRLPWLLFHRQHHMPALLTPVTTLPVFFAVPLFIVTVVPFNFIFAGITKLFSAHPLYVEGIVLNIVVVVSEIYSHSGSLYDEGRKNPIIRALGWFALNGPYHYLHHSAEPADAGRNGAVNMINLGGGLFGFWDWVFGTYSPLRETRPPTGLTGSPTLHMNPLRLAVAGMAQLAYELWHNPGLGMRMRILFGSSNWSPPISRDFALKIEPAAREDTIVARAA